AKGPLLFHFIRDACGFVLCQVRFLPEFPSQQYYYIDLPLISKDFSRHRLLFHRLSPLLDKNVPK
ncbi:MAG: hypothetical protein IJI40_04185, partial [Firmicutes bacterium]|nr:hypothetical protein [Bacillota bacterium]